MDFELTEEQKQIKALVKEFYQREVDPNKMAEIADKAAKVDTVEELRAIQPLDLVKKMHDVGLRQLGVPRKYGGTSGVTMEMNRMVASGIPGNVQTHYENVRVPEIQMIGQPNRSGEKGYSVGESVFETKWMHVGAFLGGMQRLYEHMRDYAKERVVGGRPIIQHPNIAAVLGEAAINLEALRALIYKTARVTDHRQEHGGPISLFWDLGTWYFFKKTAWRLCEIGTEIYGGIGGSVDMPLESFARSALLVMPAGSTTMMNAIKCSMEYNEHPVATQFGPK